MHCKEAREKISTYMDNELDAAASRSVASHIEQCGSCREYLHDIRYVDALVQGLRTLEVNPDFTRQVIARAREGDTYTSEKYSDRTILSAFMQFFESLFEPMQNRRIPNTHTLDEFNDFPPLSMSWAYFKILGQAGRG